MGESFTLEQVMEDQLKMARYSLENLPTLECPDGYHIRTYQQGDEAHWARIMDRTFVDNGRTAQDTYTNVINQPDFDPDGFCFVIHEDVPIGTACAWRRSLRGKLIGYIDMLAVLPEHTGHKLGKSLTVFLLHYFKARRMVSVMLDTDDFRLPAIKNYLNLGFVPVYAGENHRLRWQSVFEKLDLPQK
jgi:mycothiol synthase